jgi:hypothetical protein
MEQVGPLLVAVQLLVADGEQFHNQLRHELLPGRSNHCIPNRYVGDDGDVEPLLWYLE